MSNNVIEVQTRSRTAIEYVDYCGIIILLRKMLASGIITRKETENIARRIAEDMGVDMIISL